MDDKLDGAAPRAENGRIAEFAAGPFRRIPAVIHQTYPTRQLPDELRANTDAVRALNPGWEHRLYDDGDILAFLREHYGADVVMRYQRINAHYGAARADLFRYLLMYKVGGVYLDIKSVSDRPLDDVLAPDDEYILSKWRNRPGEIHEAHGVHRELASIGGGEFQQWHIMCRPGHPFLLAVIERVLGNIDRYRPWRDDIGKAGVLRLTGPIAYTCAIEPIRRLHPHRQVHDESVLGLRYSAFRHFTHTQFFPNHYTTRLDGIVRPTGAAALGERVYRGYRAIRQAAAVRFWYPWRDRRAAASSGAASRTIGGSPQSTE